jgi:hypothetical protein
MPSRYLVIRFLLPLFFALAASAAGCGGLTSHNGTTDGLPEAGPRVTPEERRGIGLGGSFGRALGRSVTNEGTFAKSGPPFVKSRPSFVKSGGSIASDEGPYSSGFTP